MSLLDDIKRYVDSGLKQAKLYRNATLTKFAAGTRVPGSLSGGTNPTSTTYPCRGLLAGYDAKTIALSGGLITSEDRRITVIGGSLAPGIVVEKDDKISIQDTDGVTKSFRVVASPEVDEAGGAFICQGRL